MLVFSSASMMITTILRFQIARQDMRSLPWGLHYASGTYRVRNWHGEIIQFFLYTNTDLFFFFSNS